MTSDEQGNVMDETGEIVGFFVSSIVAKRVVACVKACAGSSTEWLEFSVSEDCVDLSGPFQPIETRITEILKDGLAYMVERDELLSELERERMRLAACGVVAMADTPDGAAKARDMHPDYRSASCDDVARRVDECIQLRKQRDELLAALERMLRSYRVLKPVGYPLSDAEKIAESAIACAKGGA